MSSLLITHATVYDGTIGGVHDDYAVRVADEKITHVGPAAEAADWPAADRTIDAEGAIVTPGYIDIHHHGGGGKAYDDGPEAIDHIVAEHRAHGTTRCVMSFVTDNLDLMCERIAGAAQAVKNNPHLLGIHPEGPFLDPGHKGAHPEKELKDPSPENLQRILDAGQGTLKQLTLAPEKCCGTEAVKTLAAHGVAAAVGHTNADYEIAKEAFDNGATILTHAFNGMNGIHHRSPGPVIAALRDERVWVEVINDTIHVHPEVVRSLFTEAPDRVVLVTDAMSATCNPDGDYMLGQLEVTVDHGVARLKDGGSLAGSTLTMDKAVANAITEVGITPDHAIAAATSHAAKAISVDDEFGYIKVGYPGDLLILDKDSYLPTFIYTDGEEFAPAS